MKLKNVYLEEDKIRTQKKLIELLEMAEKENIELSIYTDDKTTMCQFMHTDSCDYIGDSIEDFPENMNILDWEIMDKEQLNRTIYANSSESAEDDELIVLIEEIEDEEDEE